MFDYLIIIFILIIWIFFYTIITCYTPFGTFTDHTGNLTYTSLVNNFDHCPLTEILWTTLPSFILQKLGLTGLGYVYASSELIVEKTPDTVLKVMGHQWHWDYDYSNFQDKNGLTIKFSSALDHNSTKEKYLINTDYHVVLPTDTTIKVLVSSSDVIHSWSIPSLSIKIDAIPGRLNQIEFKIDKYGMFRGQCSEFCGVGHGYMPIVVQSCNILDYWCYLISKASYQNLEDITIFENNKKLNFGNIDSFFWHYYFWRFFEHAFWVPEWEDFIKKKTMASFLKNLNSIKKTIPSINEKSEKIENKFFYYQSFNPFHKKLLYGTDFSKYEDKGELSIIKHFVYLSTEYENKKHIFLSSDLKKKMLEKYLIETKPTIVSYNNFLSVLNYENDEILKKLNLEKLTDYNNYNSYKFNFIGRQFMGRPYFTTDYIFKHYAFTPQSSFFKLFYDNNSDFKDNLTFEEFTKKKLNFWEKLLNYFVKTPKITSFYEKLAFDTTELKFNLREKFLKEHIESLNEKKIKILEILKEKECSEELIKKVDFFMKKKIYYIEHSNKISNLQYGFYSKIKFLNLIFNNFDIYTKDSLTLLHAKQSWGDLEKDFNTSSELIKIYLDIANKENYVHDESVNIIFTDEFEKYFLINGISNVEELKHFGFDYTVLCMTNHMIKYHPQLTCELNKGFSDYSTNLYPFHHFIKFDWSLINSYVKFIPYTDLKNNPTIEFTHLIKGADNNISGEKLVENLVSKYELKGNDCKECGDIESFEDSYEKNTKKEKCIVNFDKGDFYLPACKDAETTFVYKKGEIKLNSTNALTLLEYNNFYGNFLKTLNLYFYLKKDLYKNIFADIQVLERYKNYLSNISNINTYDPEYIVKFDIPFDKLIKSLYEIANKNYLPLEKINIYNLENRLFNFDKTQFLNEKQFKILSDNMDISHIFNKIIPKTYFFDYFKYLFKQEILNKANGTPNDENMKFLEEFFAISSEETNSDEYIKNMNFDEYLYNNYKVIFSDLIHNYFSKKKLILSPDAYKEYINKIMENPKNRYIFIIWIEKFYNVFTDNPKSHLKHFSNSYFMDEKKHVTFEEMKSLINKYDNDINNRVFDPLTKQIIFKMFFDEQMKSYLPDSYLYENYSNFLRKEKPFDPTFFKTAKDFIHFYDYIEKNNKNFNPKKFTVFMIKNIIKPFIYYKKNN